MKSPKQLRLGLPPAQFVALPLFAAPYRNKSDAPSVYVSSLKKGVL
jgi:hypothetical protein